jgi:hypothetical protein
MNSRSPRTRYLLRKALSYALPMAGYLDDSNEDASDMQELLFELDGDSWLCTDQSIWWQMSAGELLPQTGGAIGAKKDPPRLKIVPIRPTTDATDDEPAQQ